MHHTTSYRLVSAKRGSDWSIALIKGLKCLERSDWRPAEDGEELRDRFGFHLENLHDKVAGALYINNSAKNVGFWNAEAA